MAKIVQIETYKNSRQYNTFVVAQNQHDAQAMRNLKIQFVTVRYFAGKSSGFKTTQGVKCQDREVAIAIVERINHHADKHYRSKAIPTSNRSLRKAARKTMLEQKK